MRRVIVESPYAGDVDLNLRYLRACMRDCLERGEAPFASHSLYTQPGVLDDNDPGCTNGMRYGIDHATKLGHEIEYRQLGGKWSQ